MLTISRDFRGDIQPRAISRGAFAVIAICMMLALDGCDSGRRDGWKLRAGDPAPAVTLTDTDGKSVSLTDFSGKVVVMTLFATWCPPCRAELPALEDHVWKKMAAAGVQVLAVNSGEDADTVKQFAQGSGLTFPILVDEEGSVSRLLGGEGIPRAVVIDRKQRVREMEIGYSAEDFEQFVQLVEKIAKE